MFNISVRQQRFLKMWAKQFAIAMAWAIGVIIAATAFALFLMWFAIAFGMKVFGAVMLGLVTMGIVATFAGMKAEETLNKLEKEENSVLNALKKPYEPEDPQAKYNQAFIKPYIPKTNNKAYGKYINAIYGKGSTGV